MKDYTDFTNKMIDKEILQKLEEHNLILNEDIFKYLFSINKYDDFCNQIKYFSEANITSALIGYFKTIEKQALEHIKKGNKNKKEKEVITNNKTVKKSTEIEEAKKIKKNQINQSK